MTPEGWKALTLADLANVVNGVGFPREHQGSQTGRFPFFKVSDMNTPGNERELRVAANTVDVALLNSLKGTLHPPGTVVFPKVGAALLTNKRRRLVAPSCFDNNVMGLVASGCDSDYFYVLMQSVDLAKHVQPGAVPSINGSMVRSIRVLVPTLPEQSKIAAIFSSLDDAIEKTQAVIDQVQVVKRGLMQELLTRGLPGRHTRFKQTAIGEIPEGWRTSGIGEIASCDYGTSDSLHGSGSDREIPILRMANLRAGRVSLDNVKYLAVERIPDELFLSSGDVLFNRTNSADLVGKVAVFDNQEKASFASYLLRLRVKPRVGSGFWLSYLLNTGTLQRKLRATATVGVSQVNINRKSLLATVVPVPPVEEQNAIVSILNAVSLKEEVELQMADHLTEVKSALMSVLLTGELRVTPDADTR